MALGRLKNWVEEALLYTDLNAEFNNILNNPQALVTGALATSDLSNVTIGTFTATLTGCTTSPTLTVRYTKTGDQVALNFRGQGAGGAGVQGTSNAASKTLTGMPASIRPAGDIVAFGSAADNGGALVASVMKIDSAGVMTLYATIGLASWTASGVASFNLPPISYTTA